MTVTAVRSEVTISLGHDCLDVGCADLATRVYEQLSCGSYTWPCSVMPLPASITEWNQQHRTARKRANACERNGYRFLEIDRSDHEDAIFAINTSKEQRQGRPMSAGYRQRQTFSPLPDYPCYQHAIRTYGVVDSDGTLVAYTCVYRVGRLVMVSQILGHADHLRAGIMFLLFRGALEAQIAAGAGFAFYNRHDSGGDGLVWFKERLGFRAACVDWSLA